MNMDRHPWPREDAPYAPEGMQGLILDFPDNYGPLPVRREVPVSTAAGLLLMLAAFPVIVTVFIFAMVLTGCCG